MRHGSSDYRGRLLRELDASSGIVSLWDFYCPSGAVVRDLVGINHLTITGTPTRGGASKAGFGGSGSLAYPTTGDFATAADHASLDLGDGPITIGAFGTRATDSTLTETFLHKGANAYGIGIGTGGAFEDDFMFYKSAVAVLFHGGTAIAADDALRSFFAARSAAGSGNTSIYIDGTDDTAEASPATALSNTALGLEFGREGAAQRWTGKQYIAAIWARKLPASEVRYWHLLAFGG